MKEVNPKKAAYLYLALTLGASLIFWLLALLIPGASGESVFVFFSRIFTAIPVLAALLTRLILRDKSPWRLDVRVWKNGKALALSAAAPGFAVLAGAAVYYVAYPDDLPANARALFDFCRTYGLPADIPVTPATIIVTAVVIWAVSALAVPLFFLELGEEIGWRGYLLPKMLLFTGVGKAVVINGILWGLAHAPLIYFGFNYGLDYRGAPATGILLMMFFCVCVGVCMSYSMIKTGNCMYAAIIHGAVNVAADMQILSSAADRPLLGPAPTGIFGMSVIAAVAAYVYFVKIRRVKNPA